MVEFLVGTVQALCIFGLLCGAYYAITYGEELQAARAPTERFDAVTAQSGRVSADRVRHARG